jgi:hypothetical protein
MQKVKRVSHTHTHTHTHTQQIIGGVQVFVQLF